VARNSRKHAKDNVAKRRTKRKFKLKVRRADKAKEGVTKKTPHPLASALGHTKA
jgi:hypothetical protein